MSLHQIGDPTSLKTESPTTTATNMLASNLESLQPTHDEIPVHRLESTRNPYSVITPSPPSPDDDHPRDPVIELPLLETVPSIFFDPDFNLENPRTFDMVCENTDIIGGNPNNPGISTNAILQEKLSHYLDTVEVHLIKEISLRSSSFFAALSNLQALHSETLECVSRINSLRQKLAHIDNSQAKQGLEVVRLKRRRANMGRLYEGIKMVSEIRSTQPMIQVLLGQGDYFSALDLIDEANSILYGGENQQVQLEVVNNDQNLKAPASSTSRSTVIRRLSNVMEKSGSLHLRGVRVLMHFSGQLADMYKIIGTMMENDLLNMLSLDFEEYVEKVDTANSITRLCKIHHATKPNEPSTDVTMNFLGTDKGEKLKKRIMPLISGLYRMNRFSSVLQAYRERVMEEIKKITQIQKYLPSSVTLSESPDDQAGEVQNEQSSNIVKLLKGMSFDAFLNMLLSIYAVLLEGIGRIAIHSELFSNILRKAQDSGFELRPNLEILNNDNGEKDLSQNDNQTHEDDKPTDAETSTVKPQGGPSSSGSSRFSKALKITTGIKSIIQKTSSLTLKAPSSELLPKEPDTTPSNIQTKVKSDESVSDANANFHQLLSDSSQIVFAAADLAHVRCANLIAFRADQNAQLNQKDFYRLYNATWAFVLECEGLCGRMCYGLRGTILSQAKAFLNHFHMEKTKQGVTLVENEQWVQAEVPIDFQRIVDRIVTAATGGLVDFKDDPSDPLSSPISPVFPPPRTSFQIESSNNTSNGTGKKGPSPTGKLNNTSSRFIFVEERRFFVVGCSLMLLKMLGDYLRCMSNIPALTTETMNKIVEILNLFNSRTCQVILGAGAMRSAGLKNITAKHLALTSQSLGAIISLIPFIRECIRHNLDTKKFVMLTEFDRIKKDYVNHQEEIHLKLISIMNERVVVHLRSFQSINWDGTTVKDGPNSYMELLVKETITLHKVLNKYLPPETLQNVMSEVFNSSVTKLSEEISKLSIYTPTGKKRITTDAQYYITKLSTIEGIQGLMNELENTVENLQIKENSLKIDENDTIKTPQNE